MGIKTKLIRQEGWYDIIKIPKATTGIRLEIKSHDEDAWTKKPKSSSSPFWDIGHGKWTISNGSLQRNGWCSILWNCWCGSLMITNFSDKKHIWKKTLKSFFSKICAKMRDRNSQREFRVSTHICSFWENHYEGCTHQKVPRLVPLNDRVHVR